MIKTAIELEERLAFVQDQASAGRQLMDATYAAAEAGANPQVLQLMREGVSRVLDISWYDWSISQLSVCPSYVDDSVRDDLRF